MRKPFHVGGSAGLAGQAEFPWPWAWRLSLAWLELRGLHATPAELAPVVARAPQCDAAPVNGLTRLRPISRRGFTMFELLLAVVIIGIMMAMFVPQISSLTGRSAVGKAAQVVQQDLARAFGLAARLRKPVIIQADNSQKIYQVVDESGGTVRLTRRLAVGQEFGVETMEFSSNSITIQPNGVASDTLGVTLTARGSTRHISMSLVGLIRRTQ
jgi:prepilin-type N-terminal cleavage/methylation domain-containing protein